MAFDERLLLNWRFLNGSDVAILKQHAMVPRMSRPGNPYDNASCESFIKTLMREEIYISRYENLEQLRANVEIFIDEYYNKQRNTPRWGISLRRSLKTS